MASPIDPKALEVAIEEAMKNYRDRWRDHDYVHPDGGESPMLRRIGAPCARCGASHHGR